MSAPAVLSDCFAAGALSSPGHEATVVGLVIVDGRRPAKTGHSSR